MTPWRGWFIVGGLLVALGSYLAPWVQHETAGFTMNAFDLAEWASVHPAVRSSDPPMFTTFLLRLPLVISGVGLVLASSGLSDWRFRWLVRLLAALAVVRLVPPVEFFSSAQNDPNYRQMAVLAGMSGLGILLALWSTSWKMAPRAWLIAILVSGGAVAGWWGLSRAQVLFDNFEIAVQVAGGVIGYSLSAVGLCVIAAVWTRGHRNPPRERVQK